MGLLRLTFGLQGAALFRVVQSGLALAPLPLIDEAHGRAGAESDRKS